MRLRTLLNHCHKFKSFVYVNERFNRDLNQVIIDIEPRKNGRPVCSVCHKPGTTYDHKSKPRYFEFIPLWGLTILFCYTMRRVNCKTCGVKVESVPWCDGKHQTTKAYQLFLARWAKRLSWKEVAEAFDTSWESVFRSVKYAVLWGLVAQRMQGLGKVEAIGVDEIQWQKGHHYLTLVYQIDAGCYNFQTTKH